MDFRTVLAAVLGVGLGLVLIVAPNAVIHVQMAGRTPTGRRGDYGTDGEFPVRWRRVVQAVGVAAITLGLYFAWQTLS